jgi:hypothetical protein
MAECTSCGGGYLTADDLLRKAIKCIGGAFGICVTTDDAPIIESGMTFEDETNLLRFENSTNNLIFE